MQLLISPLEILIESLVIQTINSLVMKIKQSNTKEKSVSTKIQQNFVHLLHLQDLLNSPKSISSLNHPVSILYSFSLLVKQDFFSK